MAETFDAPCHIYHCLCELSDPYRRVRVGQMCRHIYTPAGTYSELAFPYEWNVTSLVDSSVEKNKRSCSGDVVW